MKKETKLLPQFINNTVDGNEVTYKVSDGDMIKSHFNENIYIAFDLANNSESYDVMCVYSYDQETGLIEILDTQKK